MLRVRDVGQVMRGFGEKIVGVNFELAGTIIGNDRLKDAGRQLGEAGDERLRGAQEEAKAAARQAEAKGHETKQRAYQKSDGRSNDKSPGNDPSAGRAAAETAKGAVKELAGKVTGSDDLKHEGREQKERGKDEGAAAKHETKAEVHKAKADAHREVSDRLREGS